MLGWRHTGSKTGADFRSRKSESTFETCVMRKRLRFSTPIRTCYISRSISGSTWSTATVVIGWSSLFSLGLFVNSAELVKIHFDYVFFFLFSFATIEMNNYGSNSKGVNFGHVCFGADLKNRRRFLRSELALIFDSENWSPKSVPVFDSVCPQP